MTRDELISKLDAFGVDESLYALGSIAARSESYSVVQTEDGWRVLYKERGELHEIAVGISESQAYDLVYEELRRAFRW